MTGTEGSVTLRGASAGLLPVVLPFLCSALLWAFVLTGSGTGMSVWAMTAMKLPPVSKMTVTPLPWTVDYTLQMVLMWWAMMLAMMLLPIGLIGHAAFKRATVTSSFAFLTGYASLWLAFSIAAAGLQQELERTELFHPFMMWSVSPVLSATLLIGAGLYQLSEFKSRTRSACHMNRLSFISGLNFGKNCVLSTTPLMLLFFAGGTMNMFWMVGLTLLVLLERFLKDHRTFDRMLAAALIVLGIWSVIV